MRPSQVARDVADLAELCKFCQQLIFERPPDRINPTGGLLFLIPGDFSSIRGKYCSVQARWNDNAMAEVAMPTLSESGSEGGGGKAYTLGGRGAYAARGVV
jgi:hypothetical protein